MTRSQRLDPLLRVKQQRQDDVAREVAERDRTLAEQEQRLDAAVAQQSRVVDDTRQHCDVERARLMLASRETHVLEKLSASYRAEESRVAEQRVQRELDDLGARRVRNGAGGGDGEVPA